LSYVVLDLGSQAFQFEISRKSIDKAYPFNDDSLTEILTKQDWYLTHLGRSPAFEGRAEGAPLRVNGLTGVREKGKALGSEIFSDGGVEGVRYFSLKVLAIEQAFIFPIGNVSHFDQHRGNIRGF
jgi:hypothetical protein